MAMDDTSYAIEKAAAALSEAKALLGVSPPGSSRTRKVDPELGAAGDSVVEGPDPDSSHPGSRIVASTDLPRRSSAVPSAS
jgi:hypothetical protein